MEEIDLKELFTYFWSKKFYIILITAITLTIGLIYSINFQTPLYKSYTTILLTKESDSTSITSNDILLNQKLVDTYKEIITSKKVLGRVINNLDLEYSVNALSSKVNVQSINGTEILKITVSDEYNVNAKNIANEIAYVFNSEIVKLYDIQNIGVIDVAELSETPYNINTTKQLIISGLVGLILSLCIVFVIYYFDDTIKTTVEVEKKLGLPVIGAIPEFGGRKND